MISVSNVHHSFQNADRLLEVIQNVSFESPSPSVISLVGPTGCGKSTLLKILGGLLEPLEGSVTFDGIPSSQILNSRRFGFVFQKPTLLPWRTAEKNVSLPLEIFGEETAAERSKEALNSVGLNGFSRSLPHQLSGGMEQRVAIARALVHKPKVMFLDEPFAAVDDITRNELNMMLLKLFKESDINVFFVTHSISEAVLLSQRILVMGPRPTGIKKSISVSLENRDDPGLVDTEEFQNVVTCVREALAT